jgi:hypothetical protein
MLGQRELDAQRKVWNGHQFLAKKDTDLNMGTRGNKMTDNKTWLINYTKDVWTRCISC